MLKKLLPTLALVFVLPVAACQSSPGPENPPSETQSSEQTKGPHPSVEEDQTTTASQSNEVNAEDYMTPTNFVGFEFGDNPLYCMIDMQPGQLLICGGAHGQFLPPDPNTQQPVNGVYYSNGVFTPISGDRGDTHYKVLEAGKKISYKGVTCEVNEDQSATCEVEGKALDFSNLAYGTRDAGQKYTNKPGDYCGTVPTRPGYQDIVKEFPIYVAKGYTDCAKAKEVFESWAKAPDSEVSSDVRSSYEKDGWTCTWLTAGLAESNKSSANCTDGGENFVATTYYPRND